MTVYGKRRSGKSVFLRWFAFLYLREFVPFFYAFTYTKHNSFLESFMPSNYVSTEFSPERLDAIMDRQKKGVKMYLDSFGNEGKYKDRINPRVAVFWDDYNGKDIVFNDALKNYYYTGRHYQTFNIFNAQYVKMTPPAIRTNTDYAVLFNNDSLANIEEYWSSFAGKMDKYAFFHLMRKYTEEVPHGFLVIDNDPNKCYDEKFFYGVAEEIPCDIDHICCCEEAWRKNYKQLVEIATGKMAEKLELISQISNPEGNLKIQDDSPSLKSGVWDPAQYRPYLDRKEGPRPVEDDTGLHSGELRRFVQSTVLGFARIQPAGRYPGQEPLREEDREGDGEQLGVRAKRGKGGRRK